MTGIVVVSLLSNRSLCADLTFHQCLKLLGGEKRSIINVDLKKYPRQNQHSVKDLKIEFFVKIVNDFQLETILRKKHHFRFVTGSEFVSDYNRSNVSYEQQKSYIKVF